MIQEIKERRSIRKFEATIVPVDLVKEAVEAASYAPSWKNTEVTRYYLINDTKKIKEIAINYTMGFTWNQNILENTHNLLILGAKQGISGFERDGSYTTTKKDSWYMFDTGAAAEALSLALADLGLGSVIMGVFDADGLEKHLGLPSDIKIVALLPFGYPAEKPLAPTRRTLEKIFKIL